MDSKSPEAFRTISEVSKDLSLPQHVLRFWETKFVQIRPIKRGGGRRYYRPEDVRLLQGIKSLLYNDGYTIRGVQKVIKENGTKQLIELNSQKSFTASKKNNNASKNVVINPKTVPSQINEDLDETIEIA